MLDLSRRHFLRESALGLAAVCAAGSVLRADAEATPASGELGAYGDYARDAAAPAVASAPAPAGRAAAELVATEDNILGPFYRPGAPCRGKVTPPLEPGTPLLIAGRVWGLDTRRPLDGAVLDVWQANADGRYDNDDPANPPAEGVFVNRCRLITDETGRYELETIHPGRYRIGRDVWRPSHIHYLVRRPGYKTLVTQLYFKGDPENARDRFIKPSLVIELSSVKAGAAPYERGTFDVVLAPA